MSCLHCKVYKQKYIKYKLKYLRARNIFLSLNDNFVNKLTTKITSISFKDLHPPLKKINNENNKINSVSYKQEYNFNYCLISLAKNYVFYNGLDENLDKLYDALEKKVTTQNQIKILMDQRFSEYKEYANLSLVCFSKNGFTVGDIAHKIFNFMTENIQIGCRDNLALVSFTFNSQTLEVCPFTDS